MSHTYNEHTGPSLCPSNSQHTNLGILFFETFVNLFHLNGIVELACPVRNSQTKQIPHTQQRSLFLPPQTPHTHTHRGSKIRRDFTVLGIKQQKLF